MKYFKVLNTINAFIRFNRIRYSHTVYEFLHNAYALHHCHSPPRDNEMKMENIFSCQVQCLPIESQILHPVLN